jgi:hypothetical protein
MCATLINIASDNTALLLLLLLLCSQAYISQLSDMTRHIQSVQHASHKEKSMASTRMAACSNSMAQQRCAGVGFTSSAAPLAYSAQAPLPAPAFQMQMAYAAPGAAAGGGGGAAAPNLALADFEFQQQQQEVQDWEGGVPWAQSNAMRKKMTSNAADYVSKRSKQ